jgi:hypothetical protein
MRFMRRTMPSAHATCPCGRIAASDPSVTVFGHAHRREQAESGLADVLDLPRPAGCRELREAAARLFRAAVALVAIAPEHRRAPSCCRSSCPLLSMTGVATRSSSRRNAEIFAKPTIVSTVPAAAVRSPRRANGLNSGSTCDASLVRRPSCSVRFGRAVGQRLRLDLLLEHHDVLREHRMHRARIEEQHAPFERRGRAPAQAFARSEIDVERRDRRRLERQAQGRAPFVELVGDPFEMARGHVAGVHELQEQRDQVLVLDRRRAAAAAAARQLRALELAEHASVNSECSSAHLAGIHCS